MRCKLGDDPWDGYQPHDTSLGNRLYHWEQAQLLYGAEYVLSFEKKYYPESEFLNFPNSIFEDDGSWDNILENLQDQWEETWLQNMAGQIKLEDNIISTITVKDPENHKKFKTLFGKYHGVHLRRGAGMWCQPRSLRRSGRVGRERRCSSSHHVSDRHRRACASALPSEP